LLQIITYYKEISGKIIGTYACIVTPNKPYYNPKYAEQEKVGQSIV
jgi:hypothetical protein